MIIPSLDLKTFKLKNKGMQPHTLEVRLSSFKDLGRRPEVKVIDASVLFGNIDSYWSQNLSRQMELIDQDITFFGKCAEWVDSRTVFTEETGEAFYQATVKVRRRAKNMHRRLKNGEVLRAQEGRGTEYICQARRAIVNPLLNHLQMLRRARREFKKGVIDRLRAEDLVSDEHQGYLLQLQNVALHIADVLRIDCSDPDKAYSSAKTYATALGISYTHPTLIVTANNEFSRIDRYLRDHAKEISRRFGAFPLPIEKPQIHFIPGDETTRNRTSHREVARA